MRRLLQLPLMGMACCMLAPALAQDVSTGEGEVIVVPVENVKFDYAQVLAVSPVYQTLRATRTEERCEPVPAEPEPSQGPAADAGLFERLVDSVKGVFSRDEPSPPPPPPPATKRNCQVVQVGREFQRPIAYDVDYVYKGTKYRSRLAEDPGNRVRVRVAVTPWEQAALPSPQP